MTELIIKASTKPFVLIITMWEYLSYRKTCTAIFKAIFTHTLAHSHNRDNIPSGFEAISCNGPDALSVTQRQSTEDVNIYVQYNTKHL